MNINVEKFLAITAALAVGSVVGCSSSDSGGTPGAGGTDSGPGAGGATSSSGGKGGTAGKTGTGGAHDAGTGGKDGGIPATGGSDAGHGGSDAGDGGPVVECLGDAPLAFDAGSQGLDTPCTTLPYSANNCLPDSGMEGSPVAVQLCSGALGTMRPGAFAALVTCLAGITATPCTKAHNDAAFACFDQVVARTCEKPKLDGGAADPCTPAAAAACPGVSVKTCHDTLRSFTDESVNVILPCLQAATLDGGSCASTFFSCLPLYVTR